MTRMLLFTVSVLCLTLLGCRKTPTAASGIKPAGQFPPLDLAVAEDTSSFQPVLYSYENEPTPEAASASREKLAQLSAKIADLKKVVATTGGGVRAEAEIQRLELERAYDRELAHFASVNLRLQRAGESLSHEYRTFRQHYEMDFNDRYARD